jgi:hypothetical protein
LRPAWEKVSETPISTKKLGMVAFTCHPSYMGGVSRKIVVQTGLGKRQEIILEK